MPRFELTLEAENDLINIWNYTRDTWGEVQADNYLSELENCCNNIGLGNDVVGKSLADVHPNLMSFHCSHHYIFFLKSEGLKPIVLAFFHEQMDLLVRLRERLV